MIFIACSVLFADYFPKMLGRISIACDEKSRQVLAWNRGGCTSRRGPSWHRCLGRRRDRRCWSSLGVTWDGGGPWGWGGAVRVGKGLEKQGTVRHCDKARPSVLFPCLQTLKSRGLSGKDRCSALQVQVSMAPLISACRERGSSWGLDGGQGNSPRVRWRRRAKGKGKKKNKNQTNRKGRRRSGGGLPKVTPQSVGTEPGAWLLPQPGDLSAGACCWKSKSIFSLPHWGCIEEKSWFLARFRAAVAKAA